VTVISHADSKSDDEENEYNFIGYNGKSSRWSQGNDMFQGF
jgi:hypothetical protein